MPNISETDALHMKKFLQPGAVSSEEALKIKRDELAKRLAMNDRGKGLIKR